VGLLLCTCMLINFEMLMNIVTQGTEQSNRQSNKYMKHSFAITRGHIITLHPSEALPLLKSAQQYLHIENMTVFHAINGSQAVQSTAVAKDVSLYTQYLMLSGLSLSVFFGWALGALTTG
jgi:hypothetical protein